MSSTIGVGVGLNAADPISPTRLTAAAAGPTSINPSHAAHADRTNDAAYHIAVVPSNTHLPHATASAQRILIAHQSPPNGSIHSGGRISMAASASQPTRPARPIATASKIFIAMISFESLILIATAITAVVLVYIDPDSSLNTRDVSSSVLNTASVAIVATAGVLTFAIDAIRLQHRFQLIATVFAHLTIVAYVVVHWRSSDLGRWFSRVSLYTLILVVTCQTIYIILAYFVLKSFGRRMYDRLRNSSVTMIQMYKTQEIYSSLLKIDSFLQLLLLLLSAFFVANLQLLPISIIASIVALICLYLGMQGVRTENSAYMRWTVILSALQPGYLIWAAREVYVDADSYAQYTFEQFIVTAGLALFCRVALLMWTYWVVQNFGLGLKERLWATDTSAAQTHQPTIVRVTNEMTRVTPSVSIASAEEAADDYERAAAMGLSHSPSSDSPITGSVPASLLRSSFSNLHPQHSDSIVGSRPTMVDHGALIPGSTHSNLFAAAHHQAFHIAHARHNTNDNITTQQQLKQRLLDDQPNQEEANQHDDDYDDDDTETYLSPADQRRQHIDDEDLV